MTRSITGYAFSFWILGLAAFVFTVLRCIYIPLSHDEVATFYYYIQPGSYIPFYAHPDANNHVLNSALAHLCYRFLGSSVGALRLPQCVALAVYLIILWQWSKTLNSQFSKMLLVLLLLLPAGLISLFSLCRGYALSITCFMGVVLYFQKSITKFILPNFIFICIWMQLSLASNLSMLFVMAVLSIVLLFGLIYFKKPWYYYAVWIIHAAACAYWYAFAQFLNAKGALYYGSGNSFWKTTVESLIQFIWIQPQLFFGYTCLVLLAGSICYACFQNTYSLLKKISALGIWIVVFAGTLFLIFFSKAFMSINYPEDRTGIYLYLIFVVISVLALEQISKAWLSRLTVILIAVTVLPSWKLIHVKNHPWRLYETFPNRFYNTILHDSQKKSVIPVIGGHRVREFIWGFQNYQSGGLLPHMYAPEQFEFLCDWSIAYPQDSVFASAYYTIVDRDPSSGFYLYKRKHAIDRNFIFKSPEQNIQLVNQEYFTLFDSVFTKPLQGPFLAEWVFKFKFSPVPFDAWVVLELKDAKNASLYYTRVPLALVRYNFNDHPFWQSHMVAPHVKDVHHMVLYLWNKSKSKISLHAQELKFYQLRGYGVDAYSKASL